MCAKIDENMRSCVKNKNSNCVKDAGFSVYAELKFPLSCTWKFLTALYLNGKTISVSC